MNHIYSNFYTTYNKITDLKSYILGIVLHDDAENYTAKDYIDWLNNRIEKNELEKGWASVYVDTDTCYWFHPTEYVEWHCGSAYANTHFIGIERCQSKRNGVLTDQEFFETECPDRAWKIHLEDAQTNPESIIKLKDYFISKIKGYYNKVVDSELENIG